MASAVETTNDTIVHRLRDTISNGTFLPPQPVPFGTTTSGMRLLSGESISSREGLRQDLTKYRKSLTGREHGFLEQLVTNGNEAEVALARQRLNDETLFFDDSWCEDKDIIGLTNDAESEGSFQYPLRYSGGTRVSSERAQKHLEQRRKTGWHGKMWKAHENGVAVMSTGLRMSLVRRSMSTSRISDIKREAAVRNSSFLSTLKTELLLEGGPTHRPGEIDIFRSGDTKKIATIETGNELIKPHSAGLIRITSDGSHKSVSFRENEFPKESRQRVSPMVHRRVRKADLQSSVENFGSDYSALDTFGATLSSSRTIDPYNCVPRAPLMPGDSMSSIPSLHLARPLRSESVSSIPSIHHATRIQSDSNLTSMACIPRVSPLRIDTISNSTVPLALHRSHPVHSDSQISLLDSSFRSDEDPVTTAWSAPLPKKTDMPNGHLLRHSSHPEVRPVLFHSASNNFHKGEGIEVTDINESNASTFLRDSLPIARTFNSLVSMGEESSPSLQIASTYNEAQDDSGVFRGTTNSQLDDDMRSYYLGTAKSLLTGSVNTLGQNKDDEDDLAESWDMDSHESERNYDAWNVIDDEYAVGYGANNTLPFRILGTSADDVDAHPHVLSPPLMESLQSFFPYSISEDNFWMKYSLLRDGASMHSLLQLSRGAKYTIIAIETVDGEVFGSFTADPWRKDWNFFGSGEAFLWRMRKPRGTPSQSIIEQAQLESELDVYPWTGENNCIQLCTHEKLAVGGGTPSSDKNDDQCVWGFGLAIDRDLITGTSSHCATFGSPPLSIIHDASPFEIVNIEVWTTTPCFSLDDAEKLELGKLFLQSN